MDYGRKNVFEIGNYEITMGRQRAVREFDLGLSVRENQALNLFAQGYCSQGAANEMGVRKNTMDTFRRRILEKLGVHTTAEAITIATACWCNAEMRERDRARIA